MSSTLFNKREVRRHNKILGRGRKSRPKSFKTEEAANEYAKKNGLKNFEIKKSLFSPKLIVVEK